MSIVKRLSYFLAGLAVLLLIAAVSLGITAGFDSTGAIWCIIGAFAAAVIGAILSVVCKFFPKNE